MSDSRQKAVNQTTGRTIAERVAVASTAWQRTRGLIGRPPLEPDEGLYLAPCRQIHTFFMKYPIDAAFLDADGRVVAAIHDLRPWRMTSYHPLAAGVLELSAGTLHRTSTAPGDVVRMVASRAD